MPDRVNLQPIKTDVTIIDNLIDIFTYYIESSKRIYAFISDKVFGLNNINFIENELGIVNDGYDNTEFYMSPNGDLIVYSDIANDFNIDDLGQLTLDEEE